LDFFAHAITRKKRVENAENAGRMKNSAEKTGA
jgi:hypothetical protein